MPNRYCIRMDTRRVLEPVPRKLAVAFFSLPRLYRQHGSCLLVRVRRSSVSGDDQAVRRLSQSRHSASEAETAITESDLGHYVATRGKHEVFRVPNT